jgi:hypothetical protein
MGSFEDRLKLANLLEKKFINLFNENFGSKFFIVKYGIETTNLKEFHNMLRTCHDITSHFIRYIPDSVLIENKSDDKHRECQTKLIEFKAAKTGLRKESFFKKLAQDCPNIPFEKKEDVFNIEKDALDLYIKLENNLNIPVIIIALASYRSDNKLFAQYASKIGICNEYNPNRRGMNQGSGTHLYNVSLKTFEPLSDFLNRELELPLEEIKHFITNLISELAKEE